jgi:predicted enzyme related to lactoylglutathione lyase
MWSRINHLAIVTDQYTLLGMFYRAAFGMQVSGDTERERGAISVGDGYVGMTLIPRPPGRYAGLDHFGIEVEDFERVQARMAEKYPDVEIVKRPGNRPFASYSTHDPAGNYFDLSQPGHENRAEVYEKKAWSQDRSLTHFAFRAREPERLAEFYVDLFELDMSNAPAADGGWHLTDGRMTMAILPWKISLFDGSGIEQPGMDHIGFKVASLEQFKADLDRMARQNPFLAAREIDYNDEGVARLKLLDRCPHGSYQIADPAGTLIDVAEA